MVFGPIFEVSEITNTITPIYTAPAGTSYIKFFRVMNNNFSQERVEIFLQKNGQPIYELFDVTLSTKESVELVDKDAAWTMNANDIIYAQTTSASGCSYFITGGIET